MAGVVTAVQPEQALSKRRFSGHYVATFAGQGAILGIGVITGVLAARILGPTGRGEFAAVTLWPTAIVTLLSLGINQAVTYLIGKRRFSFDEVCTAALVLGAVQGLLAVSIGLLVVPMTLAKYSPSVQRSGFIFALFAPALIMSGYPANLFQGAQQYGRFNIIRSMPAVTYCLALLSIYALHRGTVRSVVWCQISGLILTLVVGGTLLWRFARPAPIWNREAVVEMLHYGWRTQVTNLANTFNQRFDQLILSLFVPPDQLGLYAVAVTLSNAVTVLPQAAGIVTFSKGASQDPQSARRTIGTSFFISLVWLLVVCTIMYLVSPFLIQIVFGAKFSGSSVACRILLPGALMVGLNQVLYNGASALGRPGLPAIAEGASMVVTAVGLYLLVPRMGYIGAALVSTIAYAFSFAIMLLITKKVLRVQLRSLVRGVPLSRFMRRSA